MSSLVFVLYNSRISVIPFFTNSALVVKGLSLILVNYTKYFLFIISQFIFYKETSESCYNTIRKSWEEIDRVAVKPNGLLILSKKFRICK